MTGTTVYATTAQLKAQPDIQSGANDTVIALLLSAASRAIDGLCNRPDGFKADSVATARSYVGTSDTYTYIDEAVDVQMLEIKQGRGEPWYAVTLGDWLPFTGSPDAPNYNRLPYHGVMLAGDLGPVSIADGRSAPGVPTMPTIRVTARWGYSDTVPDLVIQATITQASRWFKRGQSAWADAAAINDFGQLFFVKSLDPDVELMLRLAQLTRTAYG